LTRLKPNDPLGADIGKYITFLESEKGVAPLTISEALCKIASKQIDLYEQSKSIPDKVDLKLLEKRAGEHIEGFTKIHQLTDKGCDDKEYLLGKLIFNKKDTEKSARKAVLDEQFRYIGVAERSINKENVIVIVFADKVVPKVDRGDLTELKQAFDLFDVNGIGKIDPKETAAAMRSLGYDIKNPTLYNIIKELDTPDTHFVDWTTFVNHITEGVEDTSNQDGLRRIFNLFIDDPNQDTITLATLKRICREIDENVSHEELKEMIERASGNGTELTFEEFCEFMNNKFNVKA
jgi:Ca2+-binding EF-hand superfamily protein